MEADNSKSNPSKLRQKAEEKLKRQQSKLDTIFLILKKHNLLMN